MKRLILVFLIISLFSCTENRKVEFNILNLIPDNSELVVITPNPEVFLDELNSNDLLGKSQFPLKTRITKELGFLRFLNLKNEAGLSISNLSSQDLSYTLITKRDSSLIPFDSIKNKAVETFNKGNVEFKRISIEDSKFFLYEKGNTSFITNSKQRVLDYDSGEKLLNSASFKRAFDASDPNKTSVFLQHSKLPEDLSSFFNDLKFSVFKNFAGWSSVDLDLTRSEIKINGISLKNNEGNFLSIFTDNDPRQSEIGKICPSDFVSYYSLGFSSFQNLHTNLKKIRKDSLSKSYPEILDHSREIATIALKDGNAVVLNVNEIEAAKEALAGLGEEIESFRGSSIVEMSEALRFAEIFKNIMTLENFQYYTIEDNFVIFSNSVEVLKNFITSYQNTDTLINKQYFTDLMSSLSSESSMLFVINSREFSKSRENQSVDLKFNKNSLAAFQVINEDNFAHLHGILSNSEKAAQSNGAEQISSFKIDSAVSTNPYFFRNHRTDQLDIAVQDENNDLYLISNKGNIFWKRNLDSQITSPIYQVDLFKNGNLQLAFSTGYNMEVLDRNGNKVKGYPIKFNQALTQPLSVFDYDNNRNYRFVLTQNKRVYMVGPKGKAITGFDFEQAGSDVVKAPKHIRLGNKDYILIAEESGKLNILSRQGKIRVPVKENLEFSENEWYGYQNSFVSTNPQQNLVKISQNGNVSSSDLGLAENNRIVASKNDLVYLNENELSINSKIVNLDFGLYTDPQLFTFRNRSLIAITDTQTQKVYVFNDKAELLEGFPVYGTSQVDIANADLDSKLELIVKGEENEILMYEF
ncbi:hypothetical protein G3I01_07285 [Gramella sp. MT6]|uniref:hypothetical protein n=1 Tax=Gramella sp. MT6 TaxID=2705471 RepID=UPI001C601ADF|nr:hypothetical protein [Gramella sp. MT6]QYA25323.1 hypothetical protein G3I01_07285 [Gramella sp. MT6]